MTACKLGLTGSHGFLSVMLVCVTLGWHAGASPVYALVFLAASPFLAACWWTHLLGRRV